jgi:O-antigen ligase
VFLVGLASLGLSAGPVGRLQTVALGAGGLGFVLAASSAGLVGLAAAVVALAALGLRARRPLRRVAWAFALGVAVALGVLALRGGDVADFLDFAADEERTETEQVESYSQRTVLAYLGGRIFLDHPVVGVGWQGSVEPEAFEPYLDDAHRRFPDEAELAFPSAERPYGVQNAYVQALADLGAVGLALLLGVFGTGLWLGLRAALAGSAAGVLALLWLLLALGVWLAQGLVTGIPLAALTWLALGLAAAGAAEARRA